MKAKANSQIPPEDLYRELERMEERKRSQREQTASVIDFLQARQRLRPVDETWPT